jgi:hypothetical protein
MVSNFRPEMYICECAYTDMHMRASKCFSFNFLVKIKQFNIFYIGNAPCANHVVIKFTLEP